MRNEQTISICLTASVLVLSLVFMIQICVQSNAVNGETLSISGCAAEQKAKRSRGSSQHLPDL